MFTPNRLIRASVICAAIVLLIVFVVAGRGTVGTLPSAVAAQASGDSTPQADRSASPGVANSIIAFLGTFSLWGSASDTIDPDVALATNGRIFYSDGPNASSSIISFLPGGSPGGAGTNLGRGFQPAVSVDGTKVAFVDNTAGAVANGGPIMLMNPDGTNRRALPNPATGFTPAWSPDGNRLAYVVGNDSGGSGGSGEIWVMDLTPGFVGTNPVKIPNTRNAQAPHWGMNNFLVWWSRDGVFGIAKLGPVPATELIATGSPLPTRLPGVQTFDVEPVWSPDATKIAFNSVRDYPNGGGSEIYTMDANGGSQTRVTNIAGSKASPTWAPDGTAIAFEHDFVLKKVNPNGSDGGNPPPVQTSGFIYNRLHWAAAGAPVPTPTPVLVSDIRVVNATGRPGEPVVVPIELVASGNEASMSFTVNFDSLRLGFVGASLGGDVPAGTSIATNELQVGLGRLGVLIDSPSAFSSGVRRFLNLTFVVQPGIAPGVAQITFGNMPTPQNVSSILGQSLTANYQAGSVTVSAPAVNGKIVYQQGGRATSSIYTITPGTGISIGLRRGFHPAYSPDGSKIIFTDNTAGATDGFLMIMNANDSSSARQLATPRQGFTPTWSPDGSRLAFIRGDFNSVGDNGKGQIYIIDMTQGNEGGNEVLIPTGTRSISKPSWGPTNRIVAACYDPFSGGGIDPRGVCVTGEIPASAQQITANPPAFTLISGQNTNDREPTWDPSGSRIAFMSTRDYPMGNASEIYSANPDGSTPTRLSNTVDFKSQPTWSPDGTKIAYSRGGTQGPNSATIRSVNADGSNPTTPATITGFGSGDVFPDWGASSAAGNDLAMLSMTDDTDPVAVGSNYNYVFSIKNNGTAPATGVKIVFDPVANFPDAVSVHPIMLNCSTAQNRSVTCTFPNLAAGTTVSQSVTFRAIQAASITMRATVSATESDQNPANDSLSHSTVIAVPADVALADPVVPTTPVAQGTVIFFTLKVVNYGPAAAQGLRLSVTLPTQFQYIEPPAPNGCTLTGNTLTCTRASLTEICSSPLTPACVGWTVQVPLLAAQATNGPPAQTIVTVSSTGAPDSSLFNNTRTVFTEISSLGGLELLGLEVTQAVQDLANSVPLVENKPTFVRAYVENRSAGTPTVRGSIIGNRIEVGGSRTPLGALTASNPGGTINVLSDSNRSLLNDSFYFELPEDWRAGNIELEFRAAGYSLDCREPDGTSDCKSLVTFRKMNKLSINFVLAKWTDASNVVHEADFGDALQTAAEIRARFPVYDFDPEITTITLRTNPCSLTPGNLVPLIENMRTQDIANGKTVKQFYMGLIPDQASCGSAYGSNGTAYSPGNSSLTFTTRNGNPGTPGRPTMDGNSRAHELAHNTGIGHTNSGGGEASPATDYQPSDGRISTGREEYGSNTAYGFDVYALNSNLDGNRIFSDTTFDFMSYKRPRWVSVFNYNKLFNFIGVAGAAGPDTPELSNTVSVTQTVVVSGTVSENPSAGTLSPLFLKETNSTIQLPAPGNYSISLRDASGQVLASYSFEPQTDSDGVKGPFALVLPWNPLAKRLVLSLNSQEIASRQASQNTPTVTVTAPNGGETLNGPTATVTWTAADADGDALTYAVDYSSNNGTSWSNLASGLTSVNYLVDLRKLPGSNQTLFRVTVSDGFNAATDQSNATCTIPPHLPTASILSPQNDQLYVGDQTIVFNGSSTDVEDGFLPGSALTWRSNLNGLLGTGNSLAVNASTLQEGTHIITLSATDTAEGVNTASITIRVVRNRPTFPAALSVGPEAINIRADVGSGQSAVQTLAIRNSGDGTLTWTATANQPWIRLSSPNGATPSNLDISADRTGLAVGNYSGTISIVASTAPNNPYEVPVNLVVQAKSTVSGRVLTPSGLGLRNALVSMIDAQGIRRTATTSSFGLFSFADVSNDETVTIAITSKRYRFTPRIVLVTGNVALSDFVGLE